MGADGFPFFAAFFCVELQNGKTTEILMEGHPVFCFFFVLKYHYGYGFGDLEGATKNHPQENNMWSAFGISSAGLT